MRARGFTQFAFEKKESDKEKEKEKEKEKDKKNFWCFGRLIKLYLLPKQIFGVSISSYVSW
jgi:hypothetical protein